MSTASILSILVYPQSSYILVYHMGLSLVLCSYLYIGSLHSFEIIFQESELQKKCIRKIALCVHFINLIY